MAFYQDRQDKDMNPMRIHFQDGGRDFVNHPVDIWEVGVVWMFSNDDYWTNCWRWFFDNEEDALKKEKFILNNWDNPPVSHNRCPEHVWCQKIWVSKEPKKVNNDI